MGDGYEDDRREARREENANRANNARKAQLLCRQIEELKKEIQDYDSQIDEKRDQLVRLESNLNSLMSHREVRL